MLANIVKQRNYIIVLHIFLALSVIVHFFTSSKLFSVLAVCVYLFFTVLIYRAGKRITNMAVKYVNSDTLLSGFFESVPDMIFYKDSDLRYVSCNDSFLKAICLSREEVIGKTDLDLFPEKIAQEISLQDANVLKLKEVAVYDQEIRAKDGTVRVYNIIKSPLFSSDKEIVGLLCIARDVTEQNTMQQEIREKQSQLNAILENIPIYTYMKDVHGNFIIGNKKVTELFGKKMSEMVGFPSYKLYDGCLGDMEGIISSEDKIVMETKEPIKFERHLNTKLGKMWVELIKSPIFNKDGDIIGILVMARDIECQKEIEVQKETFVATLTHDLKIPTIAQIKALEILLKGSLGPVSELQKEALSQVLNSCHYMFNMISTLLSTYRYESGVKNMNYESFNFPNLISECSKEISCLAQEKNQVINIKNKLNYDNIEADKLEIKRVITNLLSNAIAYSYDNSEIEIMFENNDKFISCYIKNRSEAISQEDIMSMFDKYVSNAGKYRQLGFGLGLYLSKQIVEAHKGEIFAKSDEQNGNIFGFTLPIFEPAEGRDLKSIKEHFEVK